MGSFFVDRPVFAAVISLIIVIVGAMMLATTPVTQYPDIAPPTVTVTATYPGATAEVVAKTVATPLEEQINGVERMMYLSSTSDSSGAMNLTVTFEPGTDSDMAQVSVQNKVSQVVQSLPEEVRPSVATAKKSGSFLLGISIYSPDDRYDPTYLGNYANLYLLDQIKRIPGASSAAIIPGPELAMRVWLKPDQMAALGVSSEEVTAAIRRQNRAYGIGTIGQAPAPPGTQQTFAVSARGMLADPAEFDEIIIRAAGEGSAIVRLKDVARVELAARDYAVVSRFNGKRSVTILVNQQAGANAIEVASQVRALLERLKPGFPAGIAYQVVLDTSSFTRASIHEVLKTFAIAVALVVLVVFLFLQSLRATLIPLLAVPIAIVGTFIGIKLLGFTTNMLTLFGLILAIGLVVDDAIIVVEKVAHNMATLGLPPLEATRQAMRELSGALLAIVLVLGAVFLPVAFIPGMTGTLYRQFAVTIAISMILSGLVALTLSPALAARILKPHGGEKRSFFRRFERWFSCLTSWYVTGVRWLITHRAAGVALFAGVLAAVLLLARIVPTSFIPDEDQGYLYVFSMLPAAASLERTGRVSGEILPLVRANPAVADLLQLDGMGQESTSSNSLAMVLLKPYDERTAPGRDAFSVVGDLGRKLARLREAHAVPMNPPAIPELGGMGGFEFYIQNKGSASPQELEKVTRAFIAAAGKRKELAGVTSSFSASQQQIYVDVDRARAELLGIRVSTVFETLQAYFGSLQVSTFVRSGRTCQVIVQADADYRDRPDDLTQVYVPTTLGTDLLPLSAVATVRYAAGPGSLPHFNGFPAAKLGGGKAPGYSSGQMIAAMEEVAQQVLPQGFAYQWGGQELEETRSGKTGTLAFTLGLVMVFLILAALFEKWTLPLGVVLSVPFAICGAQLSTLLSGLANDIYFRVGLLILVGLSAKNAILIIQGAADLLRTGLSPAEAALEAARQRFRPIVMTSLAFILGCVPMVFATGAGANSQHSTGTGVIGGMLASTLVASLFVPLFFVLLEEGRRIFGRGEVAAPGKEADRA